MKEKMGSGRRIVRIIKPLKGRTLMGLTNKELAEAINDSPVNVTRATQLLIEEGLMVKLETGTFALSTLMLQIATAHANEMQNAHERIMEIQQRVIAGSYSNEFKRLVG